MPMDFVSVRDFHTQPGEVWKELAGHYKLVIACNGKRFAVLTEISPTGLNHALQDLRSAQLGRALDGMRADVAAQVPDKMSTHEINAVSREVREERRRETRA